MSGLIENNNNQNMVNAPALFKAQNANEPGIVKKVGIVALKVLLAVTGIFTCASLSLVAKTLSASTSSPILSTLSKTLTTLTKKLMQKAISSNMHTYTNNNLSDIHNFFTYFKKQLLDSFEAAIQGYFQPAAVAAA